MLSGIQLQSLKAKVQMICNADAIGTLRRKEKAGGDATVINGAIKDVFCLLENNR